MEQTEQALLDSDSHAMAALLDAGSDDAQIWNPAELAAILKHQLSAPIQVDLTAMEQRLAARLRLAAGAQGLLLKSFGDLLHHPNPPLELLKLTKDFAKACRLSRAFVSLRIHTRASRYPRTYSEAHLTRGTGGIVAPAR